MGTSEVGGVESTCCGKQDTVMATPQGWEHFITEHLRVVRTTRTDRQGSTHSMQVHRARLQEQTRETRVRAVNTR